MKQNEKVFNNSYNNIYYGLEKTNKSSSIEISPLVSHIYEESTTEDITDIISKKVMDDIIYEEYHKTKWYEKYIDETKKIEKSDITDIYYYFKKILVNKNTYNSVEAFCGIAEFFKINYKMLYNDIISIEDKAEILNILKETYGLKNRFKGINQLY
jgi:hypothetical protein